MPRRRGRVEFFLRTDAAALSRSLPNTFRGMISGIRQGHVSQLASVDFSPCTTVWFEILFVFIVLAHDRDELSTSTSPLIPPPNGLLSRCSKLFRSTPPEILLRDRDGIYGQAFRKQVEIMNINEVLSAPRSPWQRAYVERVIGSIRRECLDHVIIFDEDSLRRTLRSYFRITTAGVFISRWEKIRPTPACSIDRQDHCIS
jgi:transposase InsO family protein